MCPEPALVPFGFKGEMNQEGEVTMEGTCHAARVTVKQMPRYFYKSGERTTPYLSNAFKSNVLFVEFGDGQAGKLFEAVQLIYVYALMHGHTHPTSIYAWACGLLLQ